jgi:hypothetical protein
MSAPFNRRFALEQAVLLHTRNPQPVFDQSKVSILDAATKFYNWLEEVK